MEIQEHIPCLKSKTYSTLTIAIVLAKEWFKKYYKGNMPLYINEEDYVVCQWHDFHDGEKSNIEGKQTIAICKTLKDADLLFEASINGESLDDKKFTEKDMVEFACKVYNEGYYDKSISIRDRAVILASKLTEPTLLKKLSEVTKEDAKQIIRTGYPTFFNTDNWKFKDDSEQMNEPCKCLYSRYKAYEFTFFDDDISIHVKDDEVVGFDSANFDTKIECFVEAHNLGYVVTKLKELK
jgi:hypothetical protein